MTTLISSADREEQVPAERPSRFRALASACLAHIVHDGYSDVLYLLFPIWQREFGLSLSAIGAMKGLFSGALAVFQIPAARLAASMGDRAVLVAGTLLAALAVSCYAAVGSIELLFGLLLAAGVGAAVQHPLSSAIVARAYQGGDSRSALATYNFMGDVGKVLLPAAAALLIWLFNWRVAAASLGVFGLVMAFVLLVLIPSKRGSRREVASPSTDAAANEAPTDGRGFNTLIYIGIIDNMTRTGFLTFLPLLLSARGAQAAAIGTALALIFAGGAAGKYACGVLANRMGVIRTVIATEVATALLIGAMILLPLDGAFLLMLPLGIALNGTSSVLYGSVAELAPAARRANAFALFYTATLGAGSLAPLFYGIIGDRIGIERTLLLVAAVLLLVLPLALRLPALLEKATPRMP